MSKTFYKPQRGSFFDGEQPQVSAAGHVMRRTFVERLERPGGTEVEALPQVWRCPVTGEEVMDDWQKHCLSRALEAAAVSDREVLYYHTRAWRENTKQQ